MSARDSGRLPCPACGNRSVLALAPCVVEVGAGFGGYVYGRPEVLTLPDSTAAQCNSSSCGWEGTAGQVRASRASTWIPMRPFADHVRFGDEDSPSFDRPAALRAMLEGIEGLPAGSVRVELDDAVPRLVHWWKRP